MRKRDLELRERLRREAARSRPEFSEELQARIARQLRAAARTGARGGEARGRRELASLRWRRWAAAAMVLLCLGALWSLRRGDAPGEGARPRDPLARLEGLARLAESLPRGVRAGVGSLLEPREWSRIDRDARAATRWLVGRLPLSFATASPRDESTLRNHGRPGGPDGG